MRGKPFATEHNDRTTEPIDAALVQATDARHFAQIFGARPMEQLFVSVTNDLSVTCDAIVETQ